MTLNIENRSKELASGFVKQAAVNWNQPLQAYLGGATSGGILGGLIGSGIGGLKGAISSARAADPGLGNKLKAAFRGGAKGGLKGGFIGTGVGAGLGALQTPYGLEAIPHIDRHMAFDTVKNLAAGGEGLGFPKMDEFLNKWYLVDDYKKKGADFVKDRLRSYSKVPGGFADYEAYSTGVVSPLATLGRVLGFKHSQPL